MEVRIEAAEYPRESLDESQWVLDRVVEDAFATIYALEGEAPRRLWITRSTWNLILDKRAATNATEASWKINHAPVWVALCWAMLRPGSPDQYLDQTVSAFSLRWWHCMARE